MDKRGEGRALAAQMRGYVAGEIARRTSEIEPPEVNLTSYATVDTTAIGAALRDLAPIIERSLTTADDIKDAIAEAVSRWARDDAGLVKAIESRELDLTPIVAAIAAIEVPSHGREILALSRDIAELVSATDRQTAAIIDQTARLEAVAKLSKTVSYDSAGRVKTIKVG
jgi:hypothetical protein